MNEFKPGGAGGGNLGFAFGATTVLDVWISDRDQVLASDGLDWPDERCLLIKHVLSRWRREAEVQDSYCVQVSRVNPAHIGLASSAAIQSAAWYALNHIHGYSLSESQLRVAIASAYREAGSETLELGFTTGLSSFLGFYGGFAVVGSDLKAIHHYFLPSWSAAIVAPREITSISYGATELLALTGKGPKLDVEFSSKKLEIITAELVPAVANQDLERMGSAVASIQSIGSKIAEVEIYGRVILDSIARLRNAGIPCVFMSAVGPGIALITNQATPGLEELLKQLDVDAYWVGSLDNHGVTIMPLDQYVQGRL